MFFLTFYLTKYIVSVLTFFVNEKVSLFLIYIKEADMTVFNRIKELSDKQKISIKALSLKLGFGENTIYKWKQTKPKAEDLAKVADYFHVSVDYLLGREELTVIKEPVDLADIVDESKVDWDEWVSFDGKPLTDEVKSALKLILGKRLED